MDLELSEREQSVADAFGAFFTREVPLDRVRAAEPRGFDLRLWQQVVELGLIDSVLPSALDRPTMVELILICEQAGRRLAPLPLAEAVAGARLLSGAGRPAAPADLVTFSPQVGEVGKPCLVPAAAVANVVVMYAGSALTAISGESTGHFVEVPNLGASPMAFVVPAEGDDVIAAGDEAAALHATALDEWAAMTAGLLSGLALETLGAGVAYVQARRQFGGAGEASRSAEQDLADLADLTTAAEGARLMGRRAASALDHDAADASERSALAVEFAGQTARDAARRCLQFHGGHGAGQQFDAQLYDRRAKSWSLMAGDPRAQLGRVANLRSGGPRNA